MKILEKSAMPDGTEIRLEDWRQSIGGASSLYGLAITAYPAAKHASENGRIQKGQKFRLEIAAVLYMGYGDDNVKSDFDTLKKGTKTLEDFTDMFVDRERDMWLLDMDIR